MDHSSETEHPYQEKAKTWIRTASGLEFDLLAPDPAKVRVTDIAWSISKLCRFTGQYANDDLYTVAEHCWHVSARCGELVVAGHEHEHFDIGSPAHGYYLQEVRNAARWGLLHDAAEAYVADLNSPLKHAPGMGRYREIEDGVMAAIAEKLGLGPEPPEVAVADNEMYWTERARVYGHSGPEDATREYAEPLSIRIRAWTPCQARRAWTERFSLLFPEYRE